MEISSEVQRLLKEKKITNKTIDRVFVAKNYIEKKYQMKKFSEDERISRKIFI
jgi:hypothetical protein